MSSASLDNNNIEDGWQQTYEEILSAQRLVDTLVKTIQAERIYPHLNPIPQSLFETLCAQFDEFLKLHGSLSLQITDETLVYKDTIVHEDPDMHRGIPFQLYQDGFRELTFHEGLAAEDTEKFIGIISQVQNINRQEEDFVILIWELGSPYITYRARNEFIEEATDFVSDPVDRTTSVLDTNYAEDTELPFIEPNESAGLERASDDEKVEDDTSDWKGSRRKVVELSSDEKKRLRDEVEAISHQPFELMVADILFEIIERETKSEPCRNATAVIGKIIDAKLTLNDVRGACELQQQLHLLWQAQPPDNLKAEILLDAIKSLSDQPRIERLGRLLLQTTDLTEVCDYMSGFSSSAVPELVGLLHQMPQASSRKMLCEVLATIGKDAIDSFTPFLANQDWRLVRNIAYILGMISSEQSVEQLSSTYNHPELLVRREVIKALCAIGGISVRPVLLRAITDSDAQIRGMAAATLGKVGGNAGLAILMQEVQSKNFRKKEPSEMQLFFQGIGASRSNDAIDLLQKTLFLKSWFNKEQTRVLRLGAALALSMIGSDTAQAILDSGLHSKDDSIRIACQHALNRRDMEEMGGNDV